MNDPPNTLTFAAGARAFGDGSHPTTRGMLAVLEAIDPALFTPRIACDMGAGSGILSLAIARMFGCAVVAVDLEATAVATLQRNAEANDLATRIIALRADGFDHPTIGKHAPYDLMTMNILADPLMRLATAANTHLAREGVLILSGLLQWQAPPLTQAYETLGLELTSRLTLGDWVTLVWQKP